MLLVPWFDKDCYTEIKQLNENEVIEEIARIASGDVTDVSIAHAKELRMAS